MQMIKNALNSLIIDYKLIFFNLCFMMLINLICIGFFILNKGTFFDSTSNNLSFIYHLNKFWRQ